MQKTDIRKGLVVLLQHMADKRSDKKFSATGAPQCATRKSNKPHQ